VTAPVLTFCINFCGDLAEIEISPRLAVLSGVRRFEERHDLHRARFSIPIASSASLIAVKCQAQSALFRQAQGFNPECGDWTHNVIFYRSKQEFLPANRLPKRIPKDIGTLARSLHWDLERRRR